MIIKRVSEENWMAKADRRYIKPTSKKVMYKIRFFPKVSENLQMIGVPIKAPR